MILSQLSRLCRTSFSLPQLRQACSRHLALLFSLIFCFAFFARAQQTVVPSVAFVYDFPGADPSQYAISIYSDGHASYVSNGKLTPDSGSDEPPFSMKFAVSLPTASRILDFAKQAHYFDGDISSKRKGLASTGSKTLMYKDAQTATKSDYDYSEIPAVQELTTFFQRLSATLEFGRRLEYDEHYQKLALDEELKKMEEMSKTGSLEELGSVAPILQKIADDSAAMNVVRARAQRLLEHPAGESK